MTETGSVYKSSGQQRGQQIPPVESTFAAEHTQFYPDGIPGLADTQVHSMPARQPGAALYAEMTARQGMDPLSDTTPLQAISDGGSESDADTETEDGKSPEEFFPVGTQYIAFRIQTKTGQTYFGNKLPLSEYANMDEDVMDFWENESVAFSIRMAEGVLYVPRDNVAAITVFSVDYVDNLRLQDMEQFKQDFKNASNRPPMVLPPDGQYQGPNIYPSGR